MKEIVLVVALKAKTSGFTDTVVPTGGSSTDLYTETAGPTFLTVLVRVVEFLRLGMIMEGRFTSRMEGFVLGHTVDCPLSRDIAVLL